MKGGGFYKGKFLEEILMTENDVGKLLKVRREKRKNNKVFLKSLESRELSKTVDERKLRKVKKSKVFLKSLESEELSLAERVWLVLRRQKYS